jgi:aminoglycoside phosphotransferase (APT) family kinase protein
VATSPETSRILRQFGLGAEDLIGEGGESRVYAIDDGHILRIPREGADNGSDREKMRAFLRWLDGQLPFAVPEIIDIGADEAYTVERRIAGRSLATFLKTANNDARDRALRNYVAAIDAFRGIRLDTHPYGHLLAARPIAANDWRSFAWESLVRFRSANRVAIAREIGDPYRLFDKAVDLMQALPDHPGKVLVHGDYFPGNVLIDDHLEVTGVIDFGAFTVCGDPQLDLAVAYQTLELIDECTADDARFVRDLIIERHGEEMTPAFRFYRAWLAFSRADPDNARPPYPRLYGWSVAMLKLLAEDRLPV